MLNKAMIIGNLGNDVDSGFTKSEVQVAKFSVATSKKFKDKEGNQQEHTEWHRVVCFNRLAEICIQFLSKGSKVYIEGELRTNKWEKDGQTHYTTEIIASEMKMLGDKPLTSDKKSAAAGDSSGVPRVIGMDEINGGTSIADNMDNAFDDDIPF